MSRIITDTVRFRHWVADDACWEGEANLTITPGSQSRDEFGFRYEDDQIDVTIERLYLCVDGEEPVGYYPYTHGFNMRELRDIEHAAIDAYDNPPALPVVFLEEQQTTAIAA